MKPQHVLYGALIAAAACVVCAAAALATRVAVAAVGTVVGAVVAVVTVVVLGGRATRTHQVDLPVSEGFAVGTEHDLGLGRLRGGHSRPRTVARPPVAREIGRAHV